MIHNNETKDISSTFSFPQKGRLLTGNSGAVFTTSGPAGWRETN